MVKSPILKMIQSADSELVLLQMTNHEGGSDATNHYMMFEASTSNQLAPLLPTTKDQKWALNMSRETWYD